MADIKRIQIPSGTQYTITDENALHKTAGSGEKLTGDLYLNKAGANCNIMMQNNGTNGAQIYYDPTNARASFACRNTEGNSNVSGLQCFANGQAVVYGNPNVYIRPNGASSTTSQIQVNKDNGTTVNKALAVSGTLSSTGNATVGGTLNATGATTLSSTLAVTGNTTVGGTFKATGNTTLSGTLSVGGQQTGGHPISINKSDTGLSTNMGANAVKSITSFSTAAGGVYIITVGLTTNASSGDDHALRFGINTAASLNQQYEDTRFVTSTAGLTFSASYLFTSSSAQTIYFVCNPGSVATTLTAYWVKAVRLS